MVLCIEFIQSFSFPEEKRKAAVIGAGKSGL